MADYTRQTERFTYRGISLQPQDALPEGKVAYAQNIRSLSEGTVTPRYGLSQVNNSPLGGAVHSIFRLNDTTPFAGSGAPERRFVGVGTQLLGGTPGSGVYGLVTLNPFSGNPLNAIAATPVNSPRPFLYVADSARMLKVNNDFQDMPIGIAPPAASPTALFAAVESTLAPAINAGGWTEYGASAGPTNIVIRTAPVAVVVTQLIYDFGVTGMASVALSDMRGIVPGTTVDIDAAPATPEKVIVQEVYPSVGTTTIAAIQYDSGTTGPCSIQPTGSLYTGQIEQATPAEVRRRYEDLDQPIPARVTVTRTVDFPVNALILLGGIEVVRITAVALGPDGVLSFRCTTAGTFAVGAAIAGIASFRASFVLPKIAGVAAIAFARQNTITLASTDPVVGGIQTGAAANWSLVGTRATAQHDIIRLGFRASQFAYVQSVRVYFDIDPVSGPVAFLQNYFFYEWRASDLLAAVQFAAGSATGLVSDAQAGAVLQGQVDRDYDQQYGRTSALLLDSVAPPGTTSRGNTGPTRLVGGRGRTTPTSLTDSFVSTGSTPSRQISLGDNQWVWLQCRVGDLTRVGTDVTRTLASIMAFGITVQVAAPVATVITIEIGDLYLTGGYGPDVGQTLPPYAYRYRYRSTATGERSNPSPPMRAGLSPQRGRIILTPAASGAGQVDLIDWFRYGGALARWAYVGTSLNTGSPTFNDDMEDSQIDGGESLRMDFYQPWPTFDLPRSGTGHVSGTSFRYQSGDLFDVDWAPGSTIIIAGRATSLYQSPADTTHMQIVDSCGGDNNVAWSIPGATILGQPFPTLWGGPINNAWFSFACGDPADPGLLHWSNGNDPDATTPANTLVVTNGSEPLQNGYYDDGVVYVFSTDRLFRIVPTFGDVTPFRAVPTQCTRGLWSRWFFCVLPDNGGVVFGNKQGIYYTTGGSEAQSLTDPDLQVLFPQDGSGQTESVRNLDPIDFTVVTRLKLSVIDGHLYFDYQTTTGSLRTLMYEPDYKRWTPDIYARSGVTARLGEPGPQVETHILGCADGNLYQMDADQLADVDTDINWAVWTRWQRGGDGRANFQWGDAVLDMHPGTSFTGITVTPVVDNGNVALPASVLGTLGTVRDTFIVEVNAGDAVISRTFGLLIEGTLQLCDIQRPLLYLWEPSFLFKQTIIARRATDWEDLGYKGAKFIQGVVLRVDTFNNNKQVQVQYDGGTVALTLAVQHNGERQVAYPLAAAGWTPFVAELVRLEGADALDWALMDWRWVWEPAPELATQWETQETTFDYPGFLSVYDAVMAYQAPAPVTLRVLHDANFVDYTLAATGGTYLRAYTRFQAAKGKSARFRLTSTQPFRLFKRDSSIRIQGWGLPGGFQVVYPFGGPHRVDGAAI